MHKYIFSELFKFEIINRTITYNSLKRLVIVNDFIDYAINQNDNSDFNIPLNILRWKHFSLLEIVLNEHVIKFSHFTSFQWFIFIIAFIFNADNNLFFLSAMIFPLYSN